MTLEGDLYLKNKNNQAKTLSCLFHQSLEVMAEEVGVLGQTGFR